MAVSAKVDGRQGGDIKIEFDDGQEVSGTISRWDPTTQFAHTWVINGEISSDVTYALTATDSRTELLLVHTGIPDEMCGGYVPGWHAFLARLAADLEGGAVPEWLTVFEEVAPAYQ
ncbi:MAG: SRPBCC domain-containing protein [Actinomycetia bacterium]|nr:SRPBCC domain-containing protein [Actinomycetes bacterium]